MSVSLFHHIRQKEGDLRKNNQKSDLQRICNQKRKNTPEYGPDRDTRDSSDNKDIQTHGRGNQAHFCYSNHKDTEPYGIEVQIYDQGEKYGDRQENNRHGVHNTAKRQDYKQDNTKYNITIYL